MAQTPTLANSSSPGWWSPTTPTSPAASSTASGRSTSEPGLVDPVDGFSVANPPSNARLLDALAADFVAHGYDIRRLERIDPQLPGLPAILGTARGNLDDRGNFARSLPRPMMAEVLVDALNAALGVPGDFGPERPEGSPGHRDRHQPGRFARPRAGLPGLRPARAGRRSATASGPRPRHCRRRSSS